MHGASLRDMKKREGPGSEPACWIIPARPARGVSFLANADVPAVSYQAKAHRRRGPFAVGPLESRKTPGFLRFSRQRPTGRAGHGREWGPLATDLAFSGTTLNRDPRRRAGLRSLDLEGGRKLFWKSVSGFDPLPHLREYWDDLHARFNREGTPANHKAASPLFVRYALELIRAAIAAHPR